MLSNNIIGRKGRTFLYPNYPYFVNYLGGSQSDRHQADGALCIRHELRHHTLYSSLAQVKMVEFKFCQNKTLKTPSVA